jgi:hypothetical protein
MIDKIAMYKEEIYKRAKEEKKKKTENWAQGAIKGGRIGAGIGGVLGGAAGALSTKHFGGNHITNGALGLLAGSVNGGALGALVGGIHNKAKEGKK